MTRAPLLFLLTVLPPALGACGEHSPRSSRADPPAASYDGDGRPAAGIRPSARPNVVLLCVEGVRADALSDRTRKPLMPRLLALASQGTHFTGAVSPAARTAPGAASLLTGLVPSAAGVDSRAGVSEVRDLHAMIPTLAEILAASGYRTAAWAGRSLTGKARGLEQGFQSFAEAESIPAARPAIDAWVAAAPRATSSFLFVHARPAIPDGARASNDLPGAGPVGPPPSPHAAEWAWLAAGNAAANAYGWSRTEQERYRFLESLSAADRSAMAARLRVDYDAALGHVDEAAASLLESLRARLPAPSVVVLASTHGEVFGEHDRVGAGGALHEENVRVPVVVWSKDLAPGRRQGACSHVDVAPTVLAALGLPPPPDADGFSLAEPRSTAAARVVFSQEKARVRGPDGPADHVLAAVRSARAKYVADLDSRTREATERLFDLEADPLETYPLPVVDVARFGPTFAGAVKRLQDAIQGSKDQALRLEQLGYGFAEQIEDESSPGR
jgi:arylsulfatase A-like enzyme